VEFYVDDEKIEGRLSFYSSGMDEGEKVTVFYDPDDPSDFKSKSEGTRIFVVLGFIGVAFALFGFLPPIIKAVKAKKERMTD
jgi:hypothetical protein